jgi:hypothetical protein
VLASFRRLFFIACERLPCPLVRARLLGPADLDSRSACYWDIPSSSRLSAARCALSRQSIIPGPPLLVSSSQKQVRAGRLQFVERYARYTQTVNLYAPLTLRFGLTHGSQHGLVSKICACARAQSPTRRAQRTASTLIPRAPSEVGVVDPAAGATRAVSSA